MLGTRAWSAHWVRRSRVACVLAALCVMIARTALAEPPVVEARPAPARPEPTEFQDKARLLWEAIVRDDPARAASVFFPREPFLKIKAIRDPGRYYDQLAARFERDVHALHRQLGTAATTALFSRFELARRGGYVKPGEEANRLAYWASRHSRLFYKVDGVERSLEVRVVIAWENHWYVIHLSEFR